MYGRISMRDIKAVFDIGNDTIKAVVFWKDNDKDVILAKQMEPALWLKKWKILDAEAFTTTINKIIDETGVKIDIEEDGQVFIYSQDNEKANQALEMIEDIVREVEVGGIYLGTVTRIMAFGAFVDLGIGDKEGLLHISKIAKEHIRRIEDYLQIGEKVMVKVTEIDNQGRINLAMNELREKRSVVQEDDDNNDDND